MKKIVLAFFLLTPLTAFSQAGMDPNMMQELQQMANCMASIDQKEVKAMEKEAKKFEKKVKKLCKKGKRDEAQEKALEFSKKIMSSSALATMKKCTEKMPASMKGMIPDMSAEKLAKDYENKHVCDEMK
jgi:hypothetical protein